MSRFNHTHILKHKHYVTRIGIAVLAILLLCIFCPREQKIHFSYKVGEPWKDVAVIAPDSFDIMKSERTLAAERDSNRQNYKPCFTIDGTIGKKQLERFEEYMDTIQLHSHSMMAELARRNIKTVLTNYYSAGIMEESVYHQADIWKVKNVQIEKRRNTFEPRPFKNVYSDIRVYELIRQDAEDKGYNQVFQKLQINDFIVPNMIYNDSLSKRDMQDVDALIVECAGRVRFNEKIVDQGDIVTQSTADKLQSLENFLKKRSRSSAEQTSQLLGQMLYISIMILCLFLYFMEFRSDYLYDLRYIILVMALEIIFPIMTYQVVKHDFLNVYGIPFCILPIFARVFMDSRTAFLTHFICIMLCALAVPTPFPFVCTQLIAGLVAIYSLRQLSQRSELFRAVILVTLSSLLLYVCQDLVHMSFFQNNKVNWDNYIYIGVNGLLLSISYLLLFPVERLFKFTSMVTMVELSNINHPLLRQLSEEAPGTFQHSMQVANLAAEVANKLGFKSQVVRTGALYHDIGKLGNPVYFTENQSGVNPHNNLSFEDSAQVIIQHVKVGLELAEKHHLPEVIKDLIRTHHGRSQTKYFYISYKNKYPDRPINEEIFTYPGPNPFTAEQAILMMADSVEAASRSLPEYTEESVSNLVDKIIDSMVSAGYFKTCPITFENIDQAKSIFKEKLKSIYHTRISYPELRK